MALEEIDIPEIIKKEAAEMIRRIDLAEGLLELSTLAGVAEGFIIGLNCLKALQPSDADALETLFSQAVARKMAQRA